MVDIIAHRGLGLTRTDITTDREIVNTSDNDFEAIQYFVNTKQLDPWVDFVEIDVMVVDNLLMVGHDEPMYLFPRDWYRDHRLILHCKNLEAIDYIEQWLAMVKCDYFFHDIDQATFTKRGCLWVHPRMVSSYRSIPNRALVVTNDILPTLMPPKSFVKRWGGICTDYPKEMRTFLYAI